MEQERILTLFQQFSHSLSTTLDHGLYHNNSGGISIG